MVDWNYSAVQYFQDRRTLPLSHKVLSFVSQSQDSKENERQRHMSVFLTDSNDKKTKGYVVTTDKQYNDVNRSAEHLLTSTQVHHRCDQGW